MKAVSRISKQQAPCHHCDDAALAVLFVGGTIKVLIVDILVLRAAIDRRLKVRDEHKPKLMTYKAAGDYLKAHLNGRDKIPVRA